MAGYGLPYLVGNMFELVGIRLRQLCNVHSAGLPRRPFWKHRPGGRLFATTPKAPASPKRRALRAHQDVMTTATTTAEGRSTAPHGPLGALMLGALGVVYGDIGTSPLYTMKTALEWAGGATKHD